MVDLIVPAGTVVTISQPSQVEPRYAVFRMESNSKIVASIDLKITASRAEFGENCIIDASGAPGANGNNGANGPLGVTGGAGTDGLPGQNGRSVTIEAGLTKVGGLTIITDGRWWARGDRRRWRSASPDTRSEPRYRRPRRLGRARRRRRPNLANLDATCPPPPLGAGSIAPRSRLPQQRRFWRDWRRRRDWWHSGSGSRCEWRQRSRRQ
jgi:hypothetical protein